VLTAFVERVI